jgi:hypothetical protein
VLFYRGNLAEAEDMFRTAAQAGDTKAKINLCRMLADRGELAPLGGAVATARLPQG